MPFDRANWGGKLKPLMHFYWRFSRPLTMGVRAAVIDPQGRVFLVRHGYVRGWHLPGGGVEAGETLLTALARELREEGNIELEAPPTLHGVFFNSGASRRDHVAVYVARAFRQDALPPPTAEIAESGFFAPNALPTETTSGTRARIAEIFDGRPVSETW